MPCEINNNNNFTLLNPLWITGFCDAEACFSIIISIKRLEKWKVRASFEINLHSRDIDILYKIKSYFKGIGHITERKNRCICVYRVTSINDLNNIIITHFKNYPLLTSKSSDFILWSRVIEKMLLKEHLKKRGFLSILSLYASINRGVSKKVLEYYPNIIPFGKLPYPLFFPDTPTSRHSVRLNPFWVSGFIAGDGSFSLGIRNRSKGFGIYWNFSITQHSKDLKLMKLFMSFFNSGKTRVRSNKKTPRCDFSIQDLNSIITKVIPHFDNYPLQNIKQLDYLDFKIVANMVHDNKDLNSICLANIKKIINRMNTRRC
jgi:LAGLIDADG DNA endonuclease family protein